MEAVEDNSDTSRTGDNDLLEIVSNDGVCDSTCAALAVLDKAGLIALGRKHTRDDIERAIHALTSIDWCRGVIAKVGSGGINKTARMIRSSRAEIPTYIKLRRLVTSAFDQAARLQPKQWYEWKRVTNTDMLGEIAFMTPWAVIIDRLGRGGLCHRSA